MGDVSGDGYADIFTWYPRVLNLRYGNPGASIEQREPSYRYLTYVGYGGLWAADVNSDGATDVFAAPPANVFYGYPSNFARAEHPSGVVGAPG